MDLANRSVIVTGAGRGLGAAYAEECARYGASVAVVDLDENAASRTSCHINESVRPGAAYPIAADVSDEDDVRQIARVVLDSTGRIDVLVNNAGGGFFGRTSLVGLSPAQWDRIIDVNLKGQWLCARGVATQMEAQSYGKIINISSAVVARGYPEGSIAYIAAKAGVIGLTRALARELGPLGIRVNAVAPGYVPVDRVRDEIGKESEEALQRSMLAEQCIKRLGTPQDLSEMVVFLASSHSDFVSGQLLNVDGGWAMT